MYNKTGLHVLVNRRIYTPLHYSVSLSSKSHTPLLSYGKLPVYHQVPLYVIVPVSIDRCKLLLETSFF